MEKNNKEILDKISSIYNSLENKNKIEIIESIDNLIKINDTNKDKYLDTLLNPEKKTSFKMPNSVSLPTCNYQHHFSFEDSIGSSNLETFIYNPFFMYNENMISFDSIFYGPYGSALNTGDTYNVEIRKKKNMNYGFFMNDVPLSTFLRSYGSNKFYPYNIKQGIKPIYSKYRLISSCITVKYIGVLSKASGIIRGAIITEESNKLYGRYFLTYLYGGFGDFGSDVGYYQEDTKDKTLNKYLDNNNIINSIYYKENNLIDGIKLLYFPLDNSYEEFVDLFDYDSINKIYYEPTHTLQNGYLVDSNVYVEGNKNYKTGFKFYINILCNTPLQERRRIKVDIYNNFECVPITEVLSLIPLNININYISDKEKKQVIEYIQGKSIEKISKTNNILKWDSILRQIKNIDIDEVKQKKELEFNIKKDFDELENIINNPQSSNSQSQIPQSP